VPFEPVYSIPEAVEDPQVAHLGMIVPMEQRSEGARHSVRLVFTFDRERTTGLMLLRRSTRMGRPSARR
jgi:crotonobetainyl-CoA:carnitine CoA-transferase CaiB-like acyl-CoA transferase